MSINDTLNTRQQSYGEYKHVAEIAQKLKDVLRESKNWKENNFSFYEKESLDMICNKLGRLCSGDPHHLDSWHDISGYATLAENEIRKMNLAENDNVSSFIVPNFSSKSANTSYVTSFTNLTNNIFPNKK